MSVWCSTYEELYCDKHSNKMVLSTDSVSAADAGHFESEKIEKSLISWDKIWQEVLVKEDMDLFEVVNKGTKFMNSINLPTVIVKFLKRNLNKSIVYYVIVESVTEGNSWKVPALMFSNPYAHEKTRYAELLPLCFAKCSKSVCLKPMLQRKRYRRVFRRGLFFKVKALQHGRAFDCYRERSWNMYDIRYKEMQNVLREFISRDISQLSLHLTNNVTMPLTSITETCEGFRKGICEQPVKRSPGIQNHEEKETTQGTSDHKRSIFCMTSDRPRSLFKGRMHFFDIFERCASYRAKGKKTSAYCNTFSNVE